VECILLLAYTSLPCSSPRLPHPKTLSRLLPFVLFVPTDTRPIIGCFSITFNESTGKFFAKRPTKVHDWWFRFEQLVMVSANCLTIAEMMGLDLVVGTSATTPYNPVHLFRLTEDSIFRIQCTVHSVDQAAYRSFRQQMPTIVAEVGWGEVLYASQERIRLWLSGSVTTNAAFLSNLNTGAHKRVAGFIEVCRKHAALRRIECWSSWIR
jgi:hypothetical protein